MSGTGGLFTGGPPFRPPRALPAVRPGRLARFMSGSTLLRHPYTLVRHVTLWSDEVNYRSASLRCTPGVAVPPEPLRPSRQGDRMSGAMFAYGTKRTSKAGLAISVDRGRPEAAD